MTKDYAIETKNLTVVYDVNPVLWNISVPFERGKMTAIIGPNGAGKSTLINTMLDFINPVTGDINFNLNKMSGASYKQVASHIAYVPQNTSVDWDFPATVLDVVMMGCYGYLGWFKRPGKKEKEIAREKLDKVGMATFENRQISQLSGGQRQRVFIARALAQEAELYIMDEPFAGVDMKTEGIIIKILKELKNQGKTIIVVHHDLNTVTEYFDHVVFINREIIAHGPVEDIFTDAMINETYYTDRNVGEGAGINVN